MNDSVAIQSLIEAGGIGPKALSVVSDGASLAEACCAVMEAIGKVVLEDDIGDMSNQAMASKPGAGYLDLPLCFRQDEVIRALGRASRNDAERAVRASAAKSLRQVAIEHLVTIMELAAALCMDAERHVLMCECCLWRIRERLDWSAHEVNARRVATDRDASVRAKAAQELGDYGHVTPIGSGPDWIGALIRALMADPESSVRFAAAGALRNVASYPAWNLGFLLARALQADRDGSVHRKASAALREIGYFDFATVQGLRETFEKYRHYIRSFWSQPGGAGSCS